MFICILFRVLKVNFRVDFELVKMVESGVSKADKVEFTECWNIVWTTPYIMKLAFAAGIGGLLFGYDTGNKKIYKLSN